MPKSFVFPSSLKKKSRQTASKDNFLNSCLEELMLPGRSAGHGAVLPAACSVAACQPRSRENQQRRAGACTKPRCLQMHVEGYKTQSPAWETLRTDLPAKMQMVISEAVQFADKSSPNGLGSSKLCCSAEVNPHFCLNPSPIPSSPQL